MRAAISAGYAKGLHTILDANAVTCITALILFAVATAEVKGFALMLLIGTVVSLVTAVAATRAMLGLLAGFKWFDNPRFMGATAQEIPRWQRIDVVGHRRALVHHLARRRSALSVLAIVVQGLNLGIDFKGGAQVTFTTPKPTSLSDVRNQISRRTARSSRAAAPQTGSDSYRSFQIRLKSLTAAEQAQADDRASPIRSTRASLGVKNVSVELQPADPAEARSSRSSSRSR